MKQFTIDEVVTAEDGNIYLVGRKGILRVRRQDAGYSVADFCGYYGEDEKNHTVPVRDIPCSRNRLVGGIAF